MWNAALGSRAASAGFQAETSFVNHAMSEFSSPSFPEFARRLVAALGDLPGNVVVLDEVESSNTLGRRFASDCLREGSRVPQTLLCAFRQSAGRGRRGNTWVSEGGLGIYATLLWPLPGPEALALLPVRVGVALCQGVDSLLGEGQCRLKWPNDLMVQGHKLGGILLEAVHGDEGQCAVAIGFGVNHGQGEQDLPTPRATSLRLAGVDSLDLATTGAALVRPLLEALTNPLPESELIRRFGQASHHRPGDRLRVEAGGELVEGDFLGFDERGFLRLETAQGERNVSSGEVIES